jgi:hypothetical protein
MNEANGNPNTVQAASGYDEADAVEQSTFTPGQFAAVGISVENGEESADLAAEPRHGPK